MQVRFSALEYGADGDFAAVELSYRSSTEGTAVTRNGAEHLRLGPGYRLLRTVECGVCSTDLARRWLPFPLPQVIGHELVATDAAGARYVVEINASHHARGVASDCPYCASDLPTHCPERLVLGIHDLPGGFGGWVLAPRRAMIAVPDAVPTRTAVLVEPFAAALHAVTRLQLRRHDRVAVLGPRRLGMLVIAALRGWSERQGLDLEVIALARREPLRALALDLGATTAPPFAGDGATLPDGLADVVIDTTGHPDGLPLALRLARREVHLKSTHGRPAAGLQQLTALVVDELAIGPLATAPALRGRIAWLAAAAPERAGTGTAVQRFASARDALRQLSGGDGELPGADVVVVDRAAQIDAAIRPLTDREVSLVRPRGRILVHPACSEQTDSALLGAVLRRGIELTSSRCGDFRLALELLSSSERLRGLGERLVTHRFAPTELAAAFATAASQTCIKAVVVHPGAVPGRCGDTAAPVAW